MLLGRLGFGRLGFACLGRLELAVGHPGGFGSQDRFLVRHRLAIVRDAEDVALPVDLHLVRADGLDLRGLVGQGIPLGRHRVQGRLEAGLRIVDHRRAGQGDLVGCKGLRRGLLLGSHIDLRDRCGFDGYLDLRGIDLGRQRGCF